MMSHIPLAVMMIPLILLRNEIDLKIQLSLKVFAIFEYHIILCLPLRTKEIGPLKLMNCYYYVMYHCLGLVHQLLNADYLLTICFFESERDFFLKAVLHHHQLCDRCALIQYFCEMVSQSKRQIRITEIEYLYLESRYLRCNFNLTSFLKQSLLCRRL